MTLLLAAAVVVTSFFYVRRLRSDISLGEAEMAMPGGGPAHTSYLPLSLRGNPRELWNIRLEGEISGPCAVAGRRVFAACRNGLLYCVDLESGRPLWRFDAGAEITSMPALFEGGVLVSTADGRVVCVDGEGRPRWKAEAGGSIPSSPLPAGWNVFFASRDGFLYCIDGKNGTERWRYQADAPLEVSPCFYQGQVFCASYEGTLFALDAGSGRHVWSSRLRGVPAFFPVADEGRIFQVTDAELYCLDAQSGRILWSCALGSTVISNPAVRGNQVVFLQGEKGGTSNLLSLDARTGDRLWETAMGMETGPANITATNRDVYLAGPNRLLALEMETGVPTLRADVEDVLPWTLTVTEELMLVGSKRRKVFCLGE